jgi:hypothetical protein
MSFTSVSFTRARGGLAALALAALLGLVVLVATSSASEGFNDADLTIRGGDAAAFSACINVAKAKAKVIQRTGKDSKQQKNKCDNIATATGGDVDLEKVSIEIKQEGKSKKRSNSADLLIRGGDAVAVAACVNVAQGTYTGDQVNDCVNDSLAVGGNVTLKQVYIEVKQA